MLGTARASQYAGWWNQGLNSIDFSSTSSVAPYISRPTAYSWAIHDVNSGTISSASVSPAGTIDTTPISGYSTYNYLRNSFVFSVYFDGTTWSSWATPSTNMWNGRHQIVDNSGTSWQFTTQAGLTGSNLVVYSDIGGNGGPFASITVGTASSYYNTWLTIACSTAETSSVFTSWAGGSSSGSNTQAVRLTIYNTETGTLITKSDAWYNPSNMSSLNWATGFASTLTAGSGSANTFFTNCFGTGLDTDTGNPLTPMGAYWVSFGTMFDPVGSTDTSWLTSCPGQQIDNARAVIQSQYIGYSGTGPYYNQTPAGRSLYSQTSNYDWRSNPINNANASIMYSSTIKIRNS